MDPLLDLYLDQTLWVWLAVGAIILAAEVATGTGWLLWPAASAGLMALLSLVLPGGPAVDWAVFSVLTIASTLLARRYLPRNASGEGPDINDNIGRLVGQQGVAVGAFEHGRGRVFVDGKEWAAIAEDGSSPKREQAVEIVAAEGSVLRVRAA